MLVCSDAFLEEWVGVKPFCAFWVLVSHFLFILIFLQHDLHLVTNCPFLGPDFLT